MAARDYMEIHLHAGTREPLLPLFHLADDSVSAIESYYREGEVFVARRGNETLGYAQLIAFERDGFELKSLAVFEEHRRAGIGRALVEKIFVRAKERGASRLLVSTATASIDNLRFYQQLGFRMLRIERDVFVPEAGYDEKSFLDGIPLLDRVWFDRVL